MRPLLASCADSCVQSPNTHSNGTRTTLTKRGTQLVLFLHEGANGVECFIVVLITWTILQKVGKVFLCKIQKTHW